VCNDADLDMILGSVTHRRRLVPEVVTPLTAEAVSFSGRVRGLTGKPARKMLVAAFWSACVL
jgi:hypothetical protein